MAIASEYTKFCLLVALFVALEKFKCTHNLDRSKSVALSEMIFINNFYSFMNLNGDLVRII